MKAPEIIRSAQSRCIYKNNINSMKKDKFKTKVQFLIDKSEDETESKSIFAFFPELKERNPNFALSYARVGQHSTCGFDYANECEKASESQYEILKQELENIGYNLNII